jgi:hypothetical protein
MTPSLIRAFLLIIVTSTVGRASDLVTPKSGQDSKSLLEIEVQTKSPQQDSDRGRGPPLCVARPFYSWNARLRRYLSPKKKWHITSIEWLFVEQASQKRYKAKTR